VSCSKLNTIIGIFLSVSGFLFGAAFYFLIAAPSKVQLPNGNYGEMYGPVSFFEIPVYIICGIIVLLGVYFTFLRKSGAKEN
jgi:hypothetical protein